MMLPKYKGEYYKELLDFSSFFNNHEFSDLVIHTSNDASSAKINCHKLVIKCMSAKLYEALMQNKIESKTDVDHVLVVKELQNKDESLTNLFFNIIYDGSIVEKHEDKAQLDELKDIFINYGMIELSNSMVSKIRPNISPIGNGIEKLVPKLNGANDLSDFTIYLDKEKNSYFKVHRIILQKASTYYSGLFNSGMKESNSRESIISLDADIKTNELCQLVQKLLEFVYSTSPIKQEAFESITPDILFGVSALATRYLFTGVKQQFATFIDMTREYPEYILPAIKYNDASAVVIATEALLSQISEINLNMIPIDFLQNVRVGDGGTIFHGVLSNKNVGTLSAFEQIQTLQKMLGPNAPITLQTKDDHGNNCLHFICKNSPKMFRDVVTLMISQKVNLNEKNNNGETALILALKNVYEDDNLSKDFHIEKLANGPKPEPLTVVDELIIAGAQINLENDEELKLFLTHVCHHSNGQLQDTWRVLERLLDSVSRERVNRCIELKDVMICLANGFTRPVQYLFGKIKIEISLDVRQSSTTKKEALIQVKTIDLDKIEIREKTYDIAKMKVNRKTNVTNPHHGFTEFAGFDVNVGIHHLHFEPNEQAHTLIAGLVYHVAGSKQVQETKTNTSSTKFWK